MKTALIYAMERELEGLFEKPLPTPEYECAGIKFYRLSEQTIVCVGGIGKVNAALASALLILKYSPDVIVNAGVAGSFEPLPESTAIAADSFVQHDVDTSAIGDEPGFVSTVNTKIFPASYTELAKRAAAEAGLDCRVGRIATGDCFVTDSPAARLIQKRFAPLACDMEAGAIAQVCLRTGTPFAALKTLSDCVFSDTQAADYEFSVEKAMKGLNRAVKIFVRALSEKTT